jgi:hypothetical protein
MCSTAGEDNSKLKESILRLPCIYLATSYFLWLPCWWKTDAWPPLLLLSWSSTLPSCRTGSRTRRAHRGIFHRKQRSGKSCVEDRGLRHKVAAAIAVHLFQGRGDTRYPVDCAAFEKLVSNMSFARLLDPAVAESTGGTKKIVSKFGMSEPNREDMATMTCSENIKRPFF